MYCEKRKSHDRWDQANETWRFDESQTLWRVWYVVVEVWNCRAAFYTAHTLINLFWSARSSVNTCCTKDTNRIEVTALLRCNWVGLLVWNKRYSHSLLLGLAQEAVICTWEPSPLWFSSLDVWIASTFYFLMVQDSCRCSTQNQQCDVFVAILCMATVQQVQNLYCFLRPDHIRKSAFCHAQLAFKIENNVYSSYRERQISSFSPLFLENFTWHSWMSYGGPSFGQNWGICLDVSLLKTTLSL